jgi:hypothetical protein
MRRKHENALLAVVVGVFVVALTLISVPFWLLAWDAWFLGLDRALAISGLK